MSLVEVKRALLSVSNKTDLVPFAQSLSELGIELNSIPIANSKHKSPIKADIVASLRAKAADSS